MLCALLARRAFLLVACSLCCCASCASAAARTSPPPPAPLALPRPADIARVALAAPAYRLGDQFLAGQASRVTAGSGDSALFDPHFIGTGQASGLAWAVYDLSAAGQTDGVLLRTTWSSGAAPPSAWLAVADWTRNAWSWQALDASGAAALHPATQADANGRVLAAIALTGKTPRALDSLYVGDMPPSPHDLITAGCTLVGGGNYGSRSTASAPLFEPLLWAGPQASGGDKLGLQGTLPVAGWAGYHGAGRVLLWSMHEALWGSSKDGLDDNDRFRQQAFAWLLHGGTRVACTSGHSEYVHSADLSANLRGWMDGQGIGYADLPGTIDAAALGGCDLLVVGQPAPFAPGEIDAVAAWVQNGGSLLLCAQGWSWDYSKGDHPLNLLGAPFGLHMESGIVSDPDAPNGQESEPNFTVQPLSAYTPAQVIVLKKGRDDLASVKTRAAQQPNDLFVLEGDHFGLQVPTADWPRLNDPAVAVDVLDAMYLKEVEYAGGHPPFGGAIVWAISVYDPQGAYYMHSGNPIVMKQEAGSDTVDNFNQYGVPGWGLAHENGHNLSIDACGNLYVPYGLVEPNANVFSVWVFDQLGWDWACGHADYASAGVAYHNQHSPDFNQLKGDAWILLGCFDLIWQRYGFDGMQAFLTQSAADHAGGMQAGDDAARTAYMVEGMSKAYGRDFSPLFIHWGFPVTAETQTYTAQFPASDIPIP